MSCNAHVERNENETFEHLMRRFNQQVSDSALLFEIKKRAFYMTPEEIKKYKAKQNLRRAQRTNYKKNKNNKSKNSDED